MLSPKFFRCRNTIQITKKLLGKFLIRRYRGKTLAYMITEVEAYDGFEDKASHAHRGKTERNKLMFGPAGYWYIYFTYGMHWMLNIVTGPKDYPAAVLIRSIIPERTARNFIQLSSLGAITGYDGPAKLTKALHIDGGFNGKLAAPHPWKTGAMRNSRRGLSRVRGKSGLWIEDRGVKIKPHKIKSSPRIGVAYAGPIWSKKKYRFYI